MRQGAILTGGLLFSLSLAVGLDRPGGTPAVGGPAAKMHLAANPPAQLPRTLPATFAVQIEQHPTQADPTASEPVRFEVVFSQAIDASTFTGSDVVQNGSATVGSWTVINSGDDRHFTLEAATLTAGTVIPSLPAGVVADAATKTNSGSFGTDTSVTFGPVGCTTGTFLYAGVWSPPEIHVYCVAPDGSLTSPVVVSAPGDVRDLQVSADGHSLFYAHADLAEYTISTDGSLALVGSASVGNGAFFDLTLDPSDPAGQWLYGSHSAGRVHVYDTLAQATVPALAQTVGGLYLPRGLAIRPAGDRIHVANGFPQEIHTFQLGANGLLVTAGVQVTAFDPRPFQFAMPPSLPRLYWTDSPGGSVVTGSVAGGGNVTPVASIYSGYGAGSLIIDGPGDHLYVLNTGTDDIVVFGIDGAGDLDAEQLVATPRRPEHLVLGPDGTKLYVVSSGDANGSSTITVYDVLSDGHLVDLLVPVALQQGASRLAIARP
jgi:6-phosphogluconolactonase (cycloisomerase 2 family)